MDFRDDEIAADEENTVNKNACSVETTITQLNTTGFTKKEMMIFEAKLQGQYLTIKFFKKFDFYKLLWIRWFTTQLSIA